MAAILNDKPQRQSISLWTISFHQVGPADLACPLSV